MHRLLSFLQILILTGFARTNPLSFKHSLVTRNDQIQWSPCNFLNTDPTLPTVCANLTVPLDYTDSNSNKTWTLELIKTSAVKGPSKGTVFVNYGGPGISGLTQLGAYGLYQQAVTGGIYDIIAVVPRGSGRYMPFQCWNTTAGRSAGSALIAIAGTSSDTAQGTLWAGSQIYDADCYQAQQTNGQFIGTAFAARDIVHVADILGETDVNFWGISYGTLLGQTLAQMFPDRMNRVILDGVVNGIEYYNNSEVEMFQATDATFAGFCQYCAAAPNKCILAQGNRTADQISKMIYDLLEDIKFNPIPIDLPGGGSLLGYTTVRYSIINNLYTPYTWPTLDALIYSVLTKNITALTASAPSEEPTDSGVPVTDAVRGVRCSDSVSRAAELSGVKPVLDARYNLSKIGGDFFDANTMTCAQWGFKAKEIVVPKFGSKVQTKHPVMLLNNRYDPVTALASAFNTSARFDGSVVLETNGYGHSSTAQGSLCQAKLTQAYFVNGTLPKPGTVCDVDMPYFTNSSGLNNIARELGFGK